MVSNNYLYVMFSYFKHISSKGTGSKLFLFTEKHTTESNDLANDWFTRPEETNQFHAR